MKIRLIHQSGFRVPVRILLSLLLAAVLTVDSGAAFNVLLRGIPNLTGYSQVLFLQCLDDNTIVFAQNADTKTAPASLTKLTTAALVLQNCKNLDEPVTAKQELIRMFDGTGSSNAGIKPGEILTVRQLLYCLLLPSANEAAAILADYSAGSVAAFVAQMNDFAQKLGCKNTHYMNPHGLDEDNHYTTAEDIGKIVAYAHSDAFAGRAEFEKISSALTYTIPATNKTPERLLRNTNKMLNPGVKDYYSADVTGGKTGTTDKAGDCVAVTAARNGYHYVCVVLRGTKVNIDTDAELENTAFVDSKALLNWTFAHMKLQEVAVPGTIVSEVPVSLGADADRVQLEPKEKIACLVPDGVDENSVLIQPVNAPASLTAPVTKGTVICKGKVLYAGEEFAQVDLVAAADVQRSMGMYLSYLLGEATHTLLFKALLGLLCFLTALYLLILLARAIKRRNEKQMRVLPAPDVGTKDKNQDTTKK